MLKRSQLTLVSMFFCQLLLGSASFAAAELLVSGSSYNPSCPGYFSNTLFSAEVTYTVPVDQANAPKAVSLVYSLRNSWTAKSWSVPVRTLALSSDDGRTWTGHLADLVVDERGRFHMSHLELALRLDHADGSASWDNGALAPMGFYSVTLPMASCGQGKSYVLPLAPTQSPADYAAKL